MPRRSGIDPAVSRRTSTHVVADASSRLCPLLLSATGLPLLGALCALPLPRGVQPRADDSIAGVVPPAGM